MRGPRGCSTPPGSPMATVEAMTEDALLGGRVRLGQFAGGYRVAIDPVFLAAAVPARAGDLARPPPRLAPSSFDHVMANPPHLDSHRADSPADPLKGAATVEKGPGLVDWIAFCFRMVRAGGSVTLIHRADRLDELLSAVRVQGGEVVVFPLWPDGSRAKPAKRVLVRTRKGVSTPLKADPGSRPAPSGRTLYRGGRGGAQGRRRLAALRTGGVAEEAGGAP